MMIRNRLLAIAQHASHGCSWIALVSLLIGVAIAEDGFVEVENALLKTIEATRLAAEVAGKIEELKVVEGDRVTVNQGLGRIRDTAVKLQVTRAKVAMAIARKKQQSDIDLRLAQKKSEVANDELERAESANARIANTFQPKEINRLQLVAASAGLEIERARHEQDLREFDVMVAENELRQAENLLAMHQIQSSVVGVVVAINKRVGEWVEPGTELLEIVRIDRLRIEGFINGTAINKPLVGKPANVVVLKGDAERQVAGKVVFVSPDANPVNGQVRIFLEIDNSKGEFRPGMRVKASIDVDGEAALISSSGNETKP